MLGNLFVVIIVIVVVCSIFMFAGGSVEKSIDRGTEREEMEKKRARALFDKNLTLINKQFIGFTEEFLSIKENDFNKYFFEENFADKCLRIIIEEENPKLKGVSNLKDYSTEFNTLWRLIYYFASIKLKELIDAGLFKIVVDGEERKYKIKEPFSR